MAKKFSKTPVTITGSDGTPVTGYPQKQKPSVATALANGNLSSKEALKISKSTGKDLETVMQKAVSKGGTLGSNLVNKYNSVDPSLDAYYSNNILKEGSPILQQVRSAGTLDKGSSLFIGSKGSTQTVLPKSMMSGSGTKSTAPTTDASSAPATTSSITPGGNSTNSGGLAAASASPAADPFMMGPGGMSSDLDGAAKGFRKNRSSARKAGMTTKGTGQFKNSMAQGTKTGLNIGY